MKEPKRVPAKFYQADSGREPVRDWLKDLDKRDRLSIGVDIKTVEYGWPVGMPTCRNIGKGLYEVRTDLPSDRIARVVFCVHEGCLCLLHGFIKKTQKMPQKDLKLALERKATLEGGS